MNNIILDGKTFKLESVWRKSKNDKTTDIDGNIMPFPVERTIWSMQQDFIKRLN